MPPLIRGNFLSSFIFFAVIKIVFERPQNENCSQLTHIQISNILFIEDFYYFTKN